MTLWSHHTADWPITTRLQDGTLHITDLYWRPGTVEIPGLCGLLFGAAAALTGGYLAQSLTVAIVAGLATGVGVAGLMWLPPVRAIYGGAIDIKLYPDAMEVSFWTHGGGRYARAHIAEFRIEQHQKAREEEAKERRANKRQPRTYRDAVELVMQYGERRIALAAMPDKDTEMARALLFRLQSWLNNPATVAAPAPAQSGPFGPPPPIR